MIKEISKIEAKCKIVTPMLASGANQQTFEIRSSEIKSALRFWWRAFQPESGTKLAEKEAQLFGSTDGASPFQMRVNSQSKLTTWEPDENPGWPPGLAYIFFPIYRGKTINRKDDKNPGRPVAQPGQTFHVEIKFRSYSKKQRIDLAKDILRALWLLANLGGIGGRTRRGAGCFEITSLKLYEKDVQGPNNNEQNSDFFADLPSFNNEQNSDFFADLPSFFADGQTPGDFIKSGFKSIVNAWGRKESKTKPEDFDYTSYCQNLSELCVVWDGNMNKAINVMDAIGRAMQSCRNKQPLDEAQAMHASLDKAIHSGTYARPAISTVTKASLGMPIIYNFHEDSLDPKSAMLRIPNTTKNAQFTLQGGGKDRLNKNVKRSERRSSPLLISCHEKGGTAYAVLCHLPAQLLPPGEQIYLASNYLDDRIGVLKPLPKHDFALETMRKICDRLTTNNKQGNVCIAKAGWYTPAPARPVSSPTTQPPVGTKVEVKLEVKITPPSDPKEILRDPAFMQSGRILARLAGNTNTKEKTCPCVLLTLLADGSVAEEAGWTATSKELRSLLGIKQGDLLEGKKNPQDPKRLNDLKKR